VDIGLCCDAGGDFYRTVSGRRNGVFSLFKVQIKQSVRDLIPVRYDVKLGHGYWGTAHAPTLLTARNGELPRTTLMESDKPVEPDEIFAVNRCW